MSIGAGLTLVTGPTGGGKTALVVSWLAELKDRPIFAMGIPELTIPFQPVPPVAEWTELRPAEEDPSLLLPYFTFPAGSVVVLDEAQRVFRPRAAGSKVPPEVAAFETRRHTGADFVLITQAPHLLDINLRKLVTRHVHIHDTFLGRYKLEWVGIGDPENKASRETASREKFKPPKKAFGLYKSAELHTKIVRKYPWYIYMVAIALPLTIAVAYWAYTRISGKMNKPEAELSAAQADHAKPSKSAAASDKPPVMTGAEYIKQYEPRIFGLDHTAPAYDAVTTPVEAPIPVGCMTLKGVCKCITQQGTSYRTTEDICRQFIAGGMFIPWKASEPPQSQQRQQVAAADKPMQTSTGGATYEYRGTNVQELPGGSHNFSGGLAQEKKPSEPTYTLRPSG